MRACLLHPNTCFPILLKMRLQWHSQTTCVGQMNITAAFLLVFGFFLVDEYFMAQYFPDPRSEFSYQFSGPWHFIFLIDSNLKSSDLFAVYFLVQEKKGSRHLYNSCLEKCHDKLQHRSEILLSEELTTSSLIHKYEKLGAGEKNRILISFAQL